MDVVVDTGRVKETRLDETTGLSRLVECWTSVASARQRRGRAGRVREGSCFKLFTRWSEQNHMPAHTLPEMLKTPLVCLSLARIEKRLTPVTGEPRSGGQDGP